MGYALEDSFRAFDLHTGEILWQADLPAAGTAILVTCEIHGEQYVVILPVVTASMARPWTTQWRRTS